jgi:hypothetical protein
MRLSSALTPLQVKGKKRELSFMIEDLQIIHNDLPAYLWLVKNSFIPKEENHHV